ncbi:MAG: TylF/MycF family methyltransferase [Gemmatimonadales bacterium]|nr:TylF/MycF family methyltransferase [Gemmatimonadales bacterium]
MKRTIARNGKLLMEKLIFQARKSLVEPRLDRNRDSLLISWATYSPWLLDDGFQNCHSLIKDYTLVDLYRCYELWHLLGQVKHLDGDILEVGTWRGGTGGLLGRRAKELGLDATVYLCDTFEGVVKTGSSDKSYDGGEHSDTSAPTVEELIAKLNVSNIRILTGVFPEDTAHMIENRKFRFCHIDVDVYQSGKDVLEWVWDRLPIGGLVVFDDFGFASTTGITKLVHEKEMHPGLVCVQNINGHAVFVKTS